MEEKKNNKKIIAIIVSIIVIVAIIGAVIFVLSNAQKLKLYNTTVELGQENYIEELTKQANVYIKEGYTYSVKEHKIDINNVGTYDITFEIKGKGEKIEEIKQIQVVDTTQPTVELKQNTFYIGDNINIEEIVAIKDLSQEGEIPYNEANVKIEGQFDTSKEGESKVIISATDKNGNVGTQELKINVKNPIVSIYDYIEEKLKDNDDYAFMPILLSKDNHVYIGYDYCSYSVHNHYDGWIDFTDKVSYHFETIYRKDKVPHSANNGVGKSYLDYFDNECIITKAYVDDISIYCNKEDIKLSEFEEWKNVEGCKVGKIEKIDKLLNNNGKIKLAGKTVEQLKNETIDVREFQ